MHRRHKGSSPVNGLGNAVSVLVGISGVVALISAFALFRRADVIDHLAEHTLSDVNDADDAVSGAVGFYILSQLAAGIVWIIWQFRMAKNAEKIGRLSLGPGWAIGGWFIPFASFVIPPMQLHQIDHATTGALDPAGTTPRRVRPVLLLWAIIFALGASLFGIGRVIRPSDAELTRRGLDAIDDFRRADLLAGVACFILVVAAVFAILLIQQLSTRQERLVLRGVSAPPGYPSAWSGPAGPAYPSPQQPPPAWPAPPPPPAWPAPPPPPPGDPSAGGA